MKPKFYSFLTAFVLASPMIASGASLTWNSPIAGGPWDTTTTNWLDGATPAVWNNATPDSAVFGATGAGTVGLGVPITANSITFNANGYTLGANPLTFAGTTPTINVASGVTATINSIVSGTAGYTKTGAGTVTFVGTKDLTGPVIISAGTANISTGAAGSSLTVAAGATANTTVGNAAGYNTSCRTWNINGTFNIPAGDSAWTTAVTLNNATMGSVSGANWSMGGGSSITNSGTSTFTAGGNFVLREANPGNTLPITNTGTLIFNCPITVANNVSFTNSGTINLNAANTTTGAFTVSGGNLVMGTGSALPAATLTLGSGVFFDVSAIGGFSVASGKSLTAGGTGSTDINGNLTVAGTLNTATAAGATALTVAGNLGLSAATVNFDRTSGVIDRIVLSGANRTLTLTGTNTFRAASGTFPDGTYTMISGATSITGSPANLTWASGAPGQLATFAVSGGTVQMTLTTYLAWSGTNSSVWDVNTSLNWAAGASVFQNGQDVVFPDSPTTSTVTISGTVLPSAITFTNATTPYIMRGGTGSIGTTSASLIKNGAARVTLWNNANTFSGGTTLNGGIIELNSGAALTSSTLLAPHTPLGSGLITINAGTTLQVDPGNRTGGTYYLPNAITLNGGQFYQDDGVNHFAGLLTVSAASTINCLYNSKDVYFDGGMAGSGALSIGAYDGLYGSGRVHVAADGSYSGTITISNASARPGGLVVHADNAIANANVVVNTSTETDGYSSPVPVGLVLGAPATNVTVASLNGTNVGAVVSNSDTTMRTLTVNNATDNTFAGRIGGVAASSKALNLVKNGAGTLTIIGASNYTGTTTVSAGKLSIQSSQTGTGAITVNDGATLDLGVVSGNTLSPGSLTLGTSSGATLSIRSFASSPTVAPVTTGTFTTNGAPGSVLVNVGGTFNSGTFPLVKYTGGAIGGSGASVFALGSLPRGVSATIVDDPANNVLNLVVNAATPLTWTGVNGTAWDINGTFNWSINGSPDKFQTNDVVLFDDTAGANTNVTLAITVAPASVSINTAGSSYSLTGAGAIGGSASITKSGIGTFTLGTANTFTGAVSITDGILKIGSTAALGSVATETVVSGTGVLDLNGISPAAEPISLNGGSPSGAIINSSGTASNSSGPISVAGNSSIGGSGAMTLSGSISGSATLTKVGTGTLTFSSNGGIYPFTGTLALAGGNTILTRTAGYGRLFNSPVNVKDTATLTVATENAFQTYGSVLTVESGGTLALANGVTSNIGANSGTFNMQGGSTLAGDGTNFYGSWGINTPSARINVVTGGSTAPAVISAQRVTAAGGTLNLNVADISGDVGPDLLFTGTIGTPGDSTGNLALAGGGTVVLAGINLNTGNTTVASGSKLTLADNGRMQFKIGANGVGTSISGAGTVELAGDFNLDLTGANLTSGNSWTLVNKGTLTATFDSTFTVIDFTKSGTTWTKANGSGVWTFSETTGVLSYVIDPYVAWIAGFGIVDENDRLPLADADHDGIKNAIEFVLGGNPTVSDLDLLPTTETFTNDFGAGQEEYFRFIFRRTTASATLNPHVEFGSTLTGWTEAAGTDTATLPGDVVIITIPGSFGEGIDQVQVYVPKNRAVDGKLFVRLAATAP